jgi:hypothetical protein
MTLASKRCRSRVLPFAAVLRAPVAFAVLLAFSSTAMAQADPTVRVSLAASAARYVEEHPEGSIVVAPTPQRAMAAARAQARHGHAVRNVVIGVVVVAVVATAVLLLAAVNSYDGFRRDAGPPRATGALPPAAPR